MFKLYLKNMNEGIDQLLKYVYWNLPASLEINFGNFFRTIYEIDT